GANATAIRTGSQATFDNATAIGYGAQANAHNSVAVGAGSIASDANTCPVGSLNNARRITNGAPGINATGAVNLSPLRWLDRNVEYLHDEAIAGIAISNAMATVLPRERKRVAVRVGGGFYGGQEAVGVTAAGRLNNNFTLDAGFGASTSQSEYGGKVGVTYEW